MHHFRILALPPQAPSNPDIPTANAPSHVPHTTAATGSLPPTGLSIRNRFVRSSTSATYTYPTTGASRIASCDAEGAECFSVSNALCMAIVGAVISKMALKELWLLGRSSVPGRKDWPSGSSLMAAVMLASQSLIGQNSARTFDKSQHLQRIDFHAESER